MPRKNEPTERQCAVSRKVLPIDLLIRFVLDPEGRVVPDLKQKLPGRGVWVTAAAEAVATAEKDRKRVFGRGFKSEVRVEPGLEKQVDTLMERAALQALSITRKAGELVTGFSKVDAALRAGPVAGLVHAIEASEDGVRKLAAVAASEQETANGWEIVRLFDSTQLDLALGRSNVIHAALLAGSASENFLSRVRELEAFRSNTALEETSNAADEVAQD
ncbi:transcription terminating nucleic-acid-binding protein [Roseibium sp. TrichSKD4]|uniref:RNA-binding protein n=1 Tax=Roseibium sp. TrichSKD4 TaxID=744980 RepID=UPI0001E56629|nr:RNA-binding protein [Roseibium sp. TrichSKD4]EFO32757.1 transcription terminating nucleic-acid-binding protein [Roseibium sp. TrichSKD4]